MPKWIDTDQEEKAWKKAKGIVREQRKKPEESFTGKDWSLVSSITKNILKSSTLSAATNNGLLYRLAKVDKMLQSRAVKAEKDADLPDDAKAVIEALKSVMSVGGQTIAKIRDKKDSGLDDESAEDMATDLSDIAKRLQDVLAKLNK